MFLVSGLYKLVNPELAQMNAVAIRDRNDYSNNNTLCLYKPDVVPWGYSLWVSKTLLQKLPPWDLRVLTCCFHKMTAGSRSLLTEGCDSEPWEGHNHLCTQILEELAITLLLQCSKIIFISIN